MYEFDLDDGDLELGLEEGEDLIPVDEYFRSKHAFQQQVCASCGSGDVYIEDQDLCCEDCGHSITVLA